MAQPGGKYQNATATIDVHNSDVLKSGVKDGSHMTAYGVRLRCPQDRHRWGQRHRTDLRAARGEDA